MRYVSIPGRKDEPRANYYESDISYAKVHLPSLSAIEDNDPVSTGLLDHRGNPLYRVKERGKLGF